MGRCRRTDRRVSQKEDRSGNQATKKVLASFFPSFHENQEMIAAVILLALNEADRG